MPRDIPRFARYKKRMQIHETSSEQETAAIAAHEARKAKIGDVYCLSGTLGAGKSSFARAFIRGLCGQDTDVPSPTFTLVQTYDSPAGPIWHFDLYRLKDPDEVFEIGWEDALSTGICLIEWPEKAGHNIPAMTKNISIDITGDTGRRIIIHAA